MIADENGLYSYVGLPQKDLGRTRAGIDCYGLLRLVYQGELGIDLPSYDGTYVSTREAEEIEGLIRDGRDLGPWHPVTEIRPFDAVLFRIGGANKHIGVAVDARRMLHVHTGQSVIERIGNRTWKNRFVGAWRHREVMS